MTTGSLPSPSPRKLEALNVHAELTAVFQHYQGGWADSEALRKVQELCSRLGYGYSGELAVKLKGVEQYTSILYSERKHSRYGAQGADRVRGFIWQDMNSLGQIIRRME